MFLNSGLRGKDWGSDSKGELSQCAFVFAFFGGGAVPTPYGSSLARDQTATAATPAAAVTMPNP